MVLLVDFQQLPGRDVDCRVCVHGANDGYKSHFAKVKEMAEIHYQIITADSYSELKTKLAEVENGWRPISVTVKPEPERTYTVVLELRA
jgi:hypothetical protein